MTAEQNLASTLPAHAQYRLIRTLNAIRPPPPDDLPGAETRRNDFLITRIVALHPANSAENDLDARERDRARPKVGARESRSQKNDLAVRERDRARPKVGARESRSQKNDLAVRERDRARPKVGARESRSQKNDLAVRERDRARPKVGARESRSQKNDLAANESLDGRSPPVQRPRLPLSMVVKCRAQAAQSGIARGLGRRVNPTLRQ